MTKKKVCNIFKIKFKIAKLIYIKKKLNYTKKLN